MIQINEKECTNCMMCFYECATYVIGQKRNNGRVSVYVRYPELCINCGHCVSVCRVEAITHKVISQDRLTAVSSKQINPDELQSVILKRRTIRNYKKREIPKETIETLLNSAFNAGSGHNMQDENFIIIQDRLFMKQLEELVMDIVWKTGIRFVENKMIAGILKKVHGDFYNVLLSCYRMIKYRKKNNEFGGIAIRNAPVLILAHGSKSDMLSPVHCAVALRNIELHAVTMDLGTCWMGFLLAAALRNPAKINKFLRIDKSRRIYGAIGLGYPVAEYKYLLPRKKRNVMWI